MVATVVLACGLAGTPPVAASDTLIEAETFQATADWEVQAKLPGFSGDGYLANRRRMLIAPTHPSLELTLDRAGKYDVWVRALVGGPADSGFHDREFRVEVNGTRLPPTHLGTEGHGFVWELAVPSLRRLCLRRAPFRSGATDNTAETGQPQRDAQARWVAGVRQRRE
jgi:hypothetical protein